MSNFLGGLILFLFWFFIDLVGYLVARLAIPLLSFGQAYVHPRNAPLGRFNWLGYRRDESGRVVVAEAAAGFIGFVMIVIVFLAIMLSVR